MCFSRIIFGDGYDLIERTRNYTFWLLWLIGAHHGVGFTAASLSIGEDGAIVSVKHVVD